MSQLQLVGEVHRRHSRQGVHTNRALEGGLSETEPASCCRTGSGNGNSNPLSDDVDYSAPWVNELPPEKRARIHEVRRQNQLLERCVDMLGKQQETSEELLATMKQMVKATVNHHGPFANDTEQLQVRSMVVEYIQRSLIESGFFPRSSLIDNCAQQVLGHNSMREAKKDMSKFTAVVKMANDATKQYKSETGKKVRAEFVRVWTGEGKLYDFSGKFDTQVAEAKLEDDFYRVAGEGPPEQADFFECQDLRKIFCAAFPLTQHQMSTRGIIPWNANHKIDHLTAHQLAFVDVKVRSLLRGEASIPKMATEQEVIIEHYDQMCTQIAWIIR
ncbi:hypothetical protein WJX77_010277 [Trebouxia sp. C0004]